MKGLLVVMAAGLGLWAVSEAGAGAQDAADTPGSSSTNADAASTNADASSAPAPASGRLDDAIAAKQAEIDRLKKQLEQANGEIQKLNSQNQNLQKNETVLKTQIQAAPLPSAAAEAARPQPAPLTETPPSSAPLDAHDLFWYFHNDPGQANQYLTDKPVRVSGKVVGFDAPILSHVFGVYLESGDPNLRVICRFVIPPMYSAVVFRRRTGSIIGRTPGGGEDTLLNVGDIITVEGKCRGDQDGDVAMNSCRLIL